MVYAVHRVHHSFPTRRSSDLFVVFDECHYIKNPTSQRGKAGMHLAKQDRKSTRLNSSHVAISYAVFCLKKKTYTVAGYTEREHVRTPVTMSRRIQSYAKTKT